jgi:hypothetical protein
MTRSCTEAVSVRGNGASNTHCAPTPPLLDAAAAAFVEHGFHRAQMDDVAERLGVSKGTIYRTVDSKDALFAATIAWADTPDDAPATAISGSFDLGALATSTERSWRARSSRSSPPGRSRCPGTEHPAPTPTTPPPPAPR